MEFAKRIAHRSQIEERLELLKITQELRRQLEEDRAQSQQLLAQEADSRERVEAESTATKEAVEEAIKDLESLDAERTQLRHKLQARALCLYTTALLTAPAHNEDHAISAVT